MQWTSYSLHTFSLTVHGTEVLQVALLQHCTKQHGTDLLGHGVQHKSGACMRGNNRVLFVDWRAACPCQEVSIET